jgi:D-sedoheptulose 7-phosphate isomerase
MVRSARPEDAIELFERRVAPLEALLGSAGAIADTCREMAERFAQGGTLLVFGNGGPSTDAQHVAVEFIHPVIVGKRALPALSLTADIATLTAIANSSRPDQEFARQVEALGSPVDIAMGISADGDCANVVEALRVGRHMGMLTVALVGSGGGVIGRLGLADHLICVDSADMQVIKEAHVTAYHLLWELVHVYLERIAVFSRPTQSVPTAMPKSEGW